MTSILLELRRICRNQFKCNYLRNKKFFSGFFATYLKSISYFQNYLKNDEPHSLCISKIIDYERCAYLSVLTASFYISEGSQKLLKSAWQHFHHVFSPHLGKLRWKMSLLAISEILGLFIKTLIADHRYCLRNMENITQPIQMQLSKKQKKNTTLLLHFWNLHHIFNIVKK